MRLLNTTTYELSEFFGKSIPKYAILSHRWEEDELLFTEIKSLMSGGGSTKKGWRKVRSFVTQALKDEHDWVWVDTCCIDKSSSAELSEAINSMFNYYKNAKICYAYLSDVAPLNGNHEALEEAFGRSKWFTRGWTLQELLAPSRVDFYAEDWTLLGSSRSGSMRSIVQKITGIKLGSWQFAGIAEKMFWASRRETTRVEDIAYCLMGIFGVHMAPLYGEEENAFIRLQEAIMRVSDDDSIFAWRSTKKTRGKGALLASSPACFAESGSINHLNINHLQLESGPYAMTNKGLRLETYIRPCQDPSWPGPVEDTYFAPLNCVLGHARPLYLAIYLRRVKGTQFIRIACDTFKFLDQDEAAQLKVLCQLQRPTTTLFVIESPGMIKQPQEPDMVSMDIRPILRKGFRISNSHASNRCMWNAIKWGHSADLQLITDLLLGDGSHGCAVLEFTRTSKERFAILIDISVSLDRVMIGLVTVDTTFDQVIKMVGNPYEPHPSLHEVIYKGDGIWESINLPSGQEINGNFRDLGIDKGTSHYKVDLWLPG